MARHRTTIIARSRSLNQLIGQYEREAGLKEGSVLGLVRTFEPQISPESERSDSSSELSPSVLEPYLNIQGLY